MGKKQHSKPVRIDLSALFQATAKLDDLPDILNLIDSRVHAGAIVCLTGRAPVWLYLKVAHHLHGRAGKLYYDSPASGELLIFDHDPY